VNFSDSVLIKQWRLRVIYGKQLVVGTNWQNTLLNELMWKSKRVVHDEN
jgi:hypothetical protein